MEIFLKLCNTESGIRLNNLNSDCWLWLGYKRKNGYCLYQTNWCKKMGTTHAHRISYILFRGEIPAKQVVRHKCDNPSCVNPEHLELGTQADNVRDMDDRNRRYVRRGNEVNTAKLTEEMKIDIKIMREQGIFYKDIAKKHNVHSRTIERFCIGKTYISKE